MKRLLHLLRRYCGLHVLRVMVMPLDGMPPVKVQHAQLQYVPLPLAEALRWAADPEMELSAPEIAAAYACGDLIIGVHEDGRPVGCVWFAFGRAPHTDGTWVSLRGDTRYSYRAFIRASHRGRRIAQELYTRASQICPRRGRIRGLVLIYADNEASLRASISAGRVPVGFVGYLKWGKLVLPFCSPGARRNGVKLFIAPRRVQGAPATAA